MKISQAMRERARVLGIRCALILPSLVVALGSVSALAQQLVETTVPLSDRITIDLSAGMPNQSHWLYIKDQDSTTFATPSYNDSSWTQVGIPHGANYLTTFINTTSGGGDGDLNGGNNWYRLHFTVDPQYANSKVMVEFEGAHTGAQVYINGTLLPGISAVQADAQASHVIGFLPFVVDLTPYLHADGSTQNVLAVSVSRNNSWFESPTFSGDFRFGQAEAGLFRPVKMFITNKVHIPVNVYSNQKTWGTYVATLSEVPSATSTSQAQSAVVEVQTNVLNETTTPQQVTLTTQIVDAQGNVVAVAPPATQTVQPMTPGNATTPGTFPSTATPMFDQKITLTNPTLWYPNNSTFGTPYLYHVYHIVSVNGVVVDSTESNLGVRIITWDHNFPYFNGHAMYLWGGSGRYDYPALGSSVPEEQQWRDLAQFVAAGGNIWRPGHSSSSEEFVNAADEYGVMIDQPSGDGEEAFATPPADSVTLKEELHRDMIVRDRSHPSILDWESNNGTMEESIGAVLLQLDQTWDPINTRAAADRTPDPANGYVLGCTLQGCEVGVKNQFPNNPAYGMEYWGNGTARGLAYDYELAYVAPFLDSWRQGRTANAFAMSQWYFADTPGETGLYTEYQQYNGTTQQSTYENAVRGLGDSMVDMNRFPKLLYYVYEAAWTPYALKPVVHLAHHWNRAYQAGAPIQVNAFSNCPSVKLLINGAQQGSIETPNAWNSNSESNMTQSTSLIPFQTSWMVNWVAGTVEADCLDQYGNVVTKDVQTTAGAESKIVLSVVPDVVKPDGSSFAVTANGSDVTFVTAQVQDANGNWEPTAADIVTFSVSGPATYLGGTEQYVYNLSDAYSSSSGHTVWNYHAPGDPELQFEGGMTRIAVQSQFTTGPVTVTASAPGLASGSVTFNIQGVPSFTPQPSAPAIILPPVSTAVTVGQPATFSVTATGTAPLTFQWNKGGTPISGATSASYTTPATTSAYNNTTYTVTITNAQGSATSTPAATLTTVAAAPVAITTQPQSQTVFVGQQVTLSVGANGSPSLNYQWNLNNNPIQGATGSTYTTPVLGANDNNDSFTATVTNPVNSVTSNAAVLTVGAAVAPTITQQPASLAALANDPASFTVAVSGSPPFTYQWQLGGANILGANSASYSIFQVNQTNTGNYQVVVSNAAGSVTSAVATLTIAPPGVNLALNQPATSSSDQNAGLDAAMVDDGSLTTRWGSATGVDPSWISINLGAPKPFNTVVLYWENAYALQYQIQYSNDQVNWSTAYTNNAGAGGVETLTFPTVTAQYVRMYGTKRATQYGYSLFEFQVYDVATCGGSSERYTLEGNSQVLDNVSGLTWQRGETTYTGANAQGAQYTQLIAQQYCSSVSMRLPTQAEALGISGTSSASCAFPLPWSTWTSTVDPQNPGEASFVTYTGQSSYQVADNFPGGVVCVSGTAGVQPPTITKQPTSQSAAVGATATFTVTATGTGTLSYQWYRNNSPITGANSASYTTPAATASDGGALFSVTITNSGVTVVSNQVPLTVTGGTCTAAPSAPGALTATTTAATSIALGWTASTAGSSTCPVNYDIFRSTTAGFTPSSTNQIGAAQGGITYTDTGLTAGTTYYYVVDAVDSSGTSSPSNQVSAMTPAAGAPMPDFMLAVTPNAVSVASGSTTTTTVAVEPQNGFSTNSAVTFTCSGLPAGTTCNFSAVAVSAAGSMTSTLTINSAAAAAAMVQARTGLLLAGSPLMLGLLFVRRRGQRGGRLLMVLAMTVATLTVFAGCSKTSTTTAGPAVSTVTGPSQGTTASSTVTVTATSGSVMHSTTFILTVTSTAPAS